MVIYPLAPGPFPLIVLSHGWTGRPERLSHIATAWAAAGYVVALPAFPLTNGDVPSALDNIGDVNNQPKDVSFVIDEMLALNGDDTSAVFGRIDPDRIGVAGHSLGAGTTYAVTYNSCCRDDRIKAVVIMAGFIIIAPETDDFSRSVPILVLHGDADPTLNIQLDRDTFPKLAGPKWFITLLGAEHSPPFEDAVSPWDSIVEKSTTDFWNGTLGGEAAQLTALQTDGVVPGMSTLQSGQ